MGLKKRERKIKKRVQIEQNSKVKHTEEELMGPWRLSISAEQLLKRACSVLTITFPLYISIFLPPHQHSFHRDANRTIAINVSPKNYAETRPHISKTAIYIP